MTETGLPFRVTISGSDRNAFMVADITMANAVM
jgi:hypothetical protein